MIFSGILMWLIITAVLVLGVMAMLATWYKKVPQGKAIVRTGVGGANAIFTGGFVIPVMHRAELMDISLKSFEINREGKEGLICNDNLRADIRVAFFVRVNKNEEDVKNVAQSIGTDRASDKNMLVNLFEAKFSEALKTVGKQFDFVDLYNSRQRFKEEILQTIGTDLNGYVLDDCAIDFLEQTDISNLNENNILDAEGIRKITELTAAQKVHANLLRNDEMKRIKKQDVERAEAIFELERQEEEAKAKQTREIAIVNSREEAEAGKVKEEERLKSERARIATDEEVKIAEENRDRQVLVAQKAKQKTEVVEDERIEQAQQLEATEKEKLVALAQIEKQRVLEEEKRKIQDIIRERIVVEKAVVEEEERIKDTKALAEADRNKRVKLTNAESDAEASLVAQIKSAEAENEAAKIGAQQRLTEAKAELDSSSNIAEAKKTLADAQVAEEAASGLAEAKVLKAKAESLKIQGEVEADLIEKKMSAEAKGIESRAIADRKKGTSDAEVAKELGAAEAEVIGIKAEAFKKQGMAEAQIDKEKAIVEAERIKAEAEAMKSLDGVGKELEVLRMNLDYQREVEMAKLKVQEEIAKSQAQVLSEGLKSANIDIVGGESMFFDKIVDSIARGKSVDKFVGNSEVITEIKDNLLGDGMNNSSLIANIKGFIQQFGLSPQDVKDLSIAALAGKLSDRATSETDQNKIDLFVAQAGALGLVDKTLGSLGLIGN